jgi:hypothetical protein
MQILSRIRFSTRAAQRQEMGNNDAALLPHEKACYQENIWSVCV